MILWQGWWCRFDGRGTSGRSWINNLGSRWRVNGNRLKRYRRLRSLMKTRRILKHKESVDTESWESQEDGVSHKLSRRKRFSWRRKTMSLPGFQGRNREYRGWCQKEGLDWMRTPKGWRQRSGPESVRHLFVKITCRGVPTRWILGFTWFGWWYVIQGLNK